MTKVKATKNKAKDVECIKREFSIQDRLLVVDRILPKEGNILTLTLARDIQKKMELTQAEIKKFEIKSKDNGDLTWKIQKKGVQLTLSSAEFELLKTRISELDKTNKITPQLLSLCLMIREG